jgi:hypothetical protein
MVDLLFGSTASAACLDIFRKLFLEKRSFLTFFMDCDALISGNATY